MSRELIEEGWRQLEAGIGLVTFSMLASWNAQTLRVVACKQSDFESAAGHKRVHPKFGQLICWITFGVGAEYLAKGICMLHKHDLSQTKDVLRSPKLGSSLDNWIGLLIQSRLFKAGSSATLYERNVCFGTLKTVQDRLLKLVTQESKRDLVWASFELLRDRIRKRDAHRYTENVRTFDFHTVDSLFVPAFNILLQSLDQDELRARSSDWCQ